ncbi:MULTISPECIES: hypothetical protein [Thiorhodovibrio]|uniref:hypothetical protein n=1 Tax=Thiorhodovibrio TaxID=61593 RepID=UPI0019114083|nr:MULTISPECIES: hypothetical protein [Thiorhodovibrio]MBK5970012.1 hypothetical protein [Thiorhodovibrio winogradskyi]WPL12934.1 Transposase [Thiorhodovibrio litoralis]
MAILVLQPHELTDKTVTADALLTQRKLAKYLTERGAHYLFHRQGQPTDPGRPIQLDFQERSEPDSREPPALKHGRIESRRFAVVGARCGLDTLYVFFYRRALRQYIRRVFH